MHCGLVPLCFHNDAQPAFLARHLNIKLKRTKKNNFMNIKMTKQWMHIYVYYFSFIKNKNKPLFLEIQSFGGPLSGPELDITVPSHQ